MKRAARSLLGAARAQPRDVVRSPNLLDDAASAELRVAIGQALSQGPAQLVIDLSAVTDIDADGLAVLIYACRATTAAHAKLVLSDPPPLLLELLEPMRLSELYDIELEAAHLPIRGAAS
jgi:anti-anti-sigma factor